MKLKTFTGYKVDKVDIVIEKIVKPERRGRKREEEKVEGIKLIHNIILQLRIEMLLRHSF